MHLLRSAPSATVSDIQSHKRTSKFKEIGWFIIERKRLAAGRLGWILAAGSREGQPICKLNVSAKRFLVHLVSKTSRSFKSKGGRRRPLSGSAKCRARPRRESKAHPMVCGLAMIV